VGYSVAILVAIFACAIPDFPASCRCSRLADSAMSWVGSKPRIACVASDSAPARAAQADLAARYDLVDLDDGDVIVALGGDGLLLHTIHDHLHLGRPIFGMNRGTVGFLMNQYRPDGLVERVAAATPITVHPLRLAATYIDGRRADALAFNEVAVTRLSVHSANIRLSIDGVERMAKFVGDGLIVATAAGSTAYNLSAHGPIIPLGSNLLAVTPVSPFRPRRWKGALVPHTAEIVVENLDADKRPLAATADFHELFHVVSVTIGEDTTTAVQLLFDPDHSLEERIIAEQFLS
jgi:NAD+ kinase